MTVYNRREETLSCLENCFRQIDKFSSEEKYAFTIYVNDDNSEDGLYEAVSKQFPSVRLERSKGEQYWSGGIRNIWKKAAEENYDFYIWLDHSLRLREDAFYTLLENSAFLGHKAMIVGSVAGADGNIIYGGRTKHDRIVQPDPIIPVACRVMDGNLVLVPKYVFDNVGNIDERFRHILGDYDYCVRAFRSGITRVVAPGVLADSDRIKGMETWRDASCSIKERYKAALSPKGVPFKQVFLYDIRNSGILTALGHFIVLNIQILFP